MLQKNNIGWLQHGLRLILEIIDTILGKKFFIWTKKTMNNLDKKQPNVCSYKIIKLNLIRIKEYWYDNQ